MGIGGEFIIEHWSGSFRVTSGSGKAGQTRDHDAELALFSLRHAFANHHDAVVGPVEHWYRATSGGGLGSGSPHGFPAFRSGTSRGPTAFAASSSVAAWERTRMRAWDAFEAAVRSGALGIARVEHEPVLVTVATAPPLGKFEDAREAEPTCFEATVVDEVGQPIAGLEMVLSCEGQSYDLVTNDAGVVGKAGLTASRASLRVANLQQLRGLLEPRWSAPRQGAFPQAEHLLRAELSDSIDSFSLAAKDPHLVVITPILAPLHVEWWDGRGKHRHVTCKYEVSGPRSFRGQTDELGRFLHPDVPLGDYTVKLTVEYFKRRSYAKTLTLQETITLTKGSGLQVHRVGPTPEVAFRRTRGYLFDTRKSFLMPRAAKQLQETAGWWNSRKPSHLLIVGHTDVTGEQAANDPLSKERADVVKAFLEQDVDAWLAQYDKPGASKWGSREDRLMIRALTDFAQSANTATPKPEKRETLVEWFQRTRGLEIDDVAGPETRRALIGEYMGLSTIVLRETPGYPISIATLGEGEDYPLAETGLPLDVKVSTSSDNTVNPLDRRVELFFFDTDFGILPAIGDVGGPEYIEWRKRAEDESDLAVERAAQEAKYLAVRNAQFRTDSAVMLPEGDAPNTSGVAPLTSVGILATALRYTDEHPGQSVLVAGHTDSVGSDKDNDKLSAQRAQLVHAVLTGGAAGRSTFQDVADETGTVSDWKQILKWAATTFPSVEELVTDEADTSADSASREGALGTGFTACDPGEIDDDDDTGIAAVKAFQTAYNENYTLLGGVGKISVDGEVGKQTWGAIYDLYQYNLAQELGETFDGLAKLQSLIQLLPTTKPYVGFGESAPAEGGYENDTDEQVNRRVEVLFFEYGHEPDVALLDQRPHVSELYHGEEFTRVEIPGRPGGAKAHGSVLVHLYRPLDARGRIAYRLVAHDGNYDRTLDEHAGTRGAAKDYLTLEFTEVPLTVPIDIEQVSGGRLVIVKGVKPKRALGKVSLGESSLRTDFNTEPSTRFLNRPSRESRA